MNWGFRYALDAIICRLNRKLRLSDNIKWDPMYSVQRWVERTYTPYIHNQILAGNNAILNMNNVIWVFWLQGKENMPDIVKCCYEQLLRMSGHWNVVLLDKNNYKKYIDIPSYIEEKHEKGIISNTHFSDILRFGLLAKYGGWWIDATVYPTHCFDDIVAPFYSIRNDADNKYISGCKWSAFLWKLPAKYPMAEFLYDAFRKYWVQYNALIDYWFVDHLIYLFYKVDDCFKKEIDNLNSDNDDLYFFQGPDSERHCDINKLSNLKKDNLFFKLNWRINLCDVVADSYIAVLLKG